MGEMADYYEHFYYEEPRATAASWDENISTRSRKVITKKDKQTMADVRRNKFYVGSNGVLARNWGHADLNKAVAHAKALLDEDDDKTFVFVVKIVKVVKRASRPTVVVDV